MFLLYSLYWKITVVFEIVCVNLLQNLTCFWVLSGSMMERSNDLFFLSLLACLINFVEDCLMLCAFSGSFRATIDMLRERRRPSLRVRRDMDPLRPRFRPSVATVDPVSSIPPLSSLAPAIALSKLTPPINPLRQHSHLQQNHVTKLNHPNTVEKVRYHWVILNCLVRHEIRMHFSNGPHRDCVPVSGINAVQYGRVRCGSYGHGAGFGIARQSSNWER